MEIPDRLLLKLPSETKLELTRNFARSLGLNVNISEEPRDPRKSLAESERYTMIDFDEDDWMEFFDAGLRASTVALLQSFAASPDGIFAVSQLAHACGYRQISEMRGVLAGVTKRLQTVTGQRDVSLVGYSNGGADDEGGCYFMSDQSHSSLRAHLQIEN